MTMIQCSRATLTEPARTLVLSGGFLYGTVVLALNPSHVGIFLVGVLVSLVCHLWYPAALPVIDELVVWVFLVALVALVLVVVPYAVVLAVRSLDRRVQRAKIIRGQVDALVRELEADTETVEDHLHTLATIEGSVRSLAQTLLDEQRDKLIQTRHTLAEKDFTRQLRALIAATKRWQA